MEEKNVDTSTSGGSPASSRWNPTKEQIGLLEGLYRQGLRTPSAEQIQQITSRLREYGPIEGKNVFYWFQNHKARQRQKQKQENMVYINRFLHNATPILPPPTPCTNVVCSSFGVPQSGVGFYNQYPKLLLPGGVRRRQRGDKTEKMNEIVIGGYESTHPLYDNMDVTNGSGRKINTTSAQETLQLFPLHPTGILEGRSTNSSPSTSTETSNLQDSSDFPTEYGGGYHHQFFNFFDEHGSSEN